MTNVAALAGIAVLLVGPLCWFLSRWLAKAVADELSSRFGSVARVLLAFLARIIPAEHRDERLDEWLCDIDDIDLVYADRTITRLTVGTYYALANIPGALSLRRELAPEPPRDSLTEATATIANTPRSNAAVHVAQDLWIAVLNGIGISVYGLIWFFLYIPLGWIYLVAYTGLPVFTFPFLWFAGVYLATLLDELLEGVV